MNFTITVDLPVRKADDDEVEQPIVTDFRDNLIEAMEQAFREWDDGVVWVDTTRRFPEGPSSVRYGPLEFAHKFGDRVAALMEQDQ